MIQWFSDFTSGSQRKTKRRRKQKMKKCFECGLPLRFFFFMVGGRCLCKRCSSELLDELSQLKIKIKDKRGSNNVKNN